MGERRTQAERSRTTQAALLAAARELFAARGFAATGRDQIAEHAGVTRGALYHHFDSKQALFRAVVEELEGEIVERVAAAAMRGRDPAARLRQGSMAFLDACMDPAVQRIVLLEAPVVLGWEEWREIDNRYGLALVSAGIEEAMAAGQMARAPVGPLAHVLLGGLNEAALLVATSDHPKAARRQAGQAIDLVLDGLLATE